MDWLFEGRPGVFLILTVIMGGGAAFLAGRALAFGWRSPWQVVFNMIPFTAGIRFLHFALFEQSLFSLEHFFVTGFFLVGFGLLGYRTTRVSMMTRQYPWRYEKVSPLTWRNKA